MCFLSFFLSASYCIFVFLACRVPQRFSLLFLWSVSSFYISLHLLQSVDLMMNEFSDLFFFIYLLLIIFEMCTNYLIMDAFQKKRRKNYCPFLRSFCWDGFFYIVIVVFNLLRSLPDLSNRIFHINKLIRNHRLTKWKIQLPKLRGTI